MELRIMSDIHLEFADFRMESREENKEQILVLAGDIGIVHKPSKLEAYLTFLEYCSKEFKEVLLVMGNHEHYEGSLLTTKSKLQEGIHSRFLYNVLIMDNSVKEYPEGNIVILGTTLWTDGDYQNPLAEFDWDRMMDSKVIRTGDTRDPYHSRFKYNKMVKEFLYSWHFLKENTAKYKKLGWRVVWVTHHSIASGSIPERFKGDTLTKFFSSPNKDEELLELSPEVAIHGHTHDVFDYRFGDTRIVCNPRGYVGYENTKNFDTEKVIEL